MLKVLIISPYFPPVNAADMHRIRTSLPYYEKFGWLPEVVCVDEHYADMGKDLRLSDSIPGHIKIHKVKALSKKFTAKFGLGSIALRSLWYYKIVVDKLLSKEKFDLIFFSTTQFPICILGNYWKRKFGIPYVIDMQDPWHSDYYEDKPKTERPKKYWFSYRLNKYLEPIAMKGVDGLMSVAQAYIDDLKQRYPHLSQKPFAIIPFGSHEIDFEIAAKVVKQNSIEFDKSKLNVVYTGAVGHIMKESISFLCKTLEKLKREQQAKYQLFHFYFIGTSYAPAGQGTETVMPIARHYRVADCISEKTDRVGYFESLSLLTKANALLILGSDDKAYNPSKIHTYALAKKPIIGLFKTESAAILAIERYTNGITLRYEQANAAEALSQYLIALAEKPDQPIVQTKATIVSNLAEELTRKQCELFNQVIT